MAEEEFEYCLFSWGANSYGQLGLGHKEDTLLPCKTQLPSSIAQRLSSISGGGGHAVLLTDDGAVYVCGWNKNGQCGLSSPDITIPQPLASVPLRITKVSCGWNHTLSLTEHGRVFVWGSNVFGQLSLSEINKQSNIPSELPPQFLSEVPVCDIAAGLRHSLAVTVAGKVYSWGDGKKGQLGHGVGSVVCQHSPKCIVALQTVRCKQVAAGAYHSVFITDNGSLYACGLNQHGQCGLSIVKTGDEANQVKVSPDSTTILNVYVPLKVEGLPPVVEVCCGWSHNMAVSVKQEVFTWGRADYGQIGREISKREKESTNTGGRATFCPEPTAVPQLKIVKQIFCGSEHNIVLSDDNEVITFGWNEHGMCATGDENNVQCPHVITAESLKSWTPLLVGGGAGHSMIMVHKPLR